MNVYILKTMRAARTKACDIVVIYAVYKSLFLKFIHAQYSAQKSVKI